MSKVFYDHLILIDELFAEVDLVELTSEEKKQAKKKIDDLVHHKVLTKILDLLPREHHEEFLIRFHAAPHDHRHLTYLKEKGNIDVQTELVELSNHLKKDLRHLLSQHKSKK